MKILFYIHSLVIGGAETIVVNEMISLKKRGVNVALIVNKTENTFLEEKVLKENIKIYYLNKPYPDRKYEQIKWKISIRFSNYKNIMNSIIKMENPDLIHVNTTMNRLNGIDFPATKMIFSFHSDVRRFMKVNNKRNIEIIKKYSQNGMSFFALSNKMTNDIKQIFQTPNVVKIPNSVNIKNIRKYKYDRQTFLDSIDIPKDAYVLGHIGRFNIVKNHEKIISVFNALHLRRKNSYLLLIGGDSNNRMQIIKRMVQSLGLNEYVRFLNIREDATSIIGCLDGFILPSFSESFSISLVEAEVLHIRCVVSDQVPDDVICNDNCFKMSLDKSDKEWADMLLGNSTQERNNDIEQFDVDAVTLKLVKAYEEIIDDTKNS